MKGVLNIWFKHYGQLISMMEFQFSIAMATSDYQIAK